MVTAQQYFIEAIYYSNRSAVLHWGYLYVATNFSNNCRAEAIVPHKKITTSKDHREYADGPIVQKMPIIFMIIS